MQKLDLAGALLSTMDADTSGGQESDYVDTSDGLLHCGTCRAPKERLLPAPAFMREAKGETLHIPKACVCAIEEQEKEDAERRERRRIQRAAELRAVGIQDARLRECTFDTDDGKSSKVSAMCRRYVERWEKVRANRIGLLMWGATGCGKTFFAACIANALIEHEVGVILATIPDLTARMTSNYGDGRDAVLAEVRRAPLLILDDVGFERLTPTGLENAFAIVDTRYNSGRPLIVTTNLTLEEVRNPADMAHKRMLSRIAELCAVPVHVEGNRREGIAQDRRARALEVLLGDG